MNDISFDDDLKAALLALRSGGVILYPTDTIWGLGCDATDEKAVEKLYDLKARAGGKPSLSLVDSTETLSRYVATIPEAAETIIRTADSPVTIIYDHPRDIAPSLIADDGSAAFRITSEKFSRELCRRFQKPIVSTSANHAGGKTPRCFDEIDPQLIEKADYTPLYGRDASPASSASEIIKVGDDNSIKVIRGK